MLNSSTAQELEKLYVHQKALKHLIRLEFSSLCSPMSLYVPHMKYQDPFRESIRSLYTSQKQQS